MTSPRPPTVWIDDSHAIVRRGMAACLQQADFVVRGESAVLSPEPVIADLDVLVFEYAGVTLRRAAGQAIFGGGCDSDCGAGGAAGGFAFCADPAGRHRPRRHRAGGP